MMIPHWKNWNIAEAKLVAVVLLASKTSRVASDEINFSMYARNATLSSNLDLFWTIDSELATIRVAVHAKAASGWAGLGISEMGGMEGADIVYYEAETGNITDAYAIAAGMPVTDECTQDWTMVSAEIGADGLVFEVERALDTGDSQDRVFADDSVEGTSPTTLIAAWGDTESIAYHGADSVQGSVIIFGGDENSDVDPLLEITSSPSVSSFDVAAKNFSIPTDRTWYEDTCVPAAELPALDEYHAIGFEAIVHNSTSEYVHHLVLTAFNGSDDCGQSCYEWYNNRSQSSSSYSTTGDDSETPSFCSYDFTYIYIWAPGIADEQLPDDVGFRFGPTSGGYTSIQVEIHYNNVDGDEGVIDSSGVRVYYTEELRPMDMGVLSLGDPGVLLMGESILEGKSSIAFECPGSCTEENFEKFQHLHKYKWLAVHHNKPGRPDAFTSLIITGSMDYSSKPVVQNSLMDAENVTVYSHFLHMHENGQRMITRQYRDDGNGNEVLVHIAEVEYYSFLQAGGYVVKANDSMTIQKGDRFETECHYDTALSSISADGVEFGLGSENEMCIDFLYYYPKQYVPRSGSCGFGYCDGNITRYSALDADSDFNRTFGISTSCEEEESGQEQQSSSTSIQTPGLATLLLAAFTLLFTSGCLSLWLK